MVLQVCGFVALLTILYNTVLFLRKIPSHISWVGSIGDSVYGCGTGFLRSIVNTHTMVEEGYKKYTKNGQSFVLPQLFTGAEIMIPPSYLNWIVDQSEKVLSSFEAHREFMRADWTLLDPSIIHEHIFKSAISIQLTRRLDRLEDTLMAEVPVALARNVAPTDGKWNEVDSYWCWKNTVLQTVSRVYVGDLCRDPEYLHSAASFNQFSMITAAMIGLVPKQLRPILAPILCLPDRYFHSKSAQKLKPLLQQRSEAIKGLNADEIEKCMPNDLLTWAAVDAFESKSSHKMSLDFLAARISVMNFVSIDSTTITITNVMCDILCHPHDGRDERESKIPLVDRIREEMLQAHNSNSKYRRQTRRTFTERLPLLDACLKESFRMGNFISRSALKMVVKEEGVDIPGVGHIPKGVKIGVPLWGLHHDEEIYKDPYQWKMSRWLDAAEREKSYVFGGSGSGVGQEYHPFGYRHNACPGRFYAMRVVKILLAHLFINYDIEVVGGVRPSNPWIGVSRGPPMGRLKLRSRASTVTEKSELGQLVSTG